jgi:bifunctional isochorismate lyase/aryl carrier protein
MKEVYFTSLNIAGKAREMLESVQRFSRPHPFNFIPEASALLLLDFQSYFLDEGSHAYVPSSKAILPGVSALIEAYARRGLPIIQTRHINTAEDAGLMATWWRDVLVEDHPYSLIDPQLEYRDGILLKKTRYDAFFETDLDRILKEKRIRQLVICGVMTHLCCETTARSAFMRGFEVFFVVDGTATYNEAFHRASLLNLSHGFAHLALVTGILSLIGDAARG